MKKIAIIGGGLIVLVIVGLLVLLSNIDSIIKAAVEEVGSEATQAKVTLNEVEISTEGVGALRGFSVGNPAGFETPNAFKLGEVSVSLDVASVTEDTVHIREVIVAGPEVTFEWKSGGSNLEVLKRNVEKFAGITGDSKSGGASGESTQKAESDGGKKLIIDKIVLRDGKVSVSANAAFLKGKTLDAPLPNIELNDIGKEEGGASAGDVIAQVMDAVTGAAGKAVGSLNIGELTKSLDGLTAGAMDALKGGASGATDAVQKGMSGASDTMKKGAEEATGTLKKLFGN